VKQSLTPPGQSGRANAGLTESAQLARWAGPAFILFSVIMLPWTVYLAYTLPGRQRSPHYDVAWVGFDVLLLLTLAATGWLAVRRSGYLALAAAATATMLVVDAWFDVMTSPRHQLPQSLTLAVLIELPLAAICAWLSYHTQHIQEQRILLLGRHPSGSRGQRAGRTRRTSA
jgi:hypothetical protein